MLNVEQVYDFGKKGWINEMILMVGFSGILDIGKEEEVRIIKDKLEDGTRLLVDLLVFWLD